MDVRSSVTVNNAVLAILWLGMAGFVVFHSLVLLWSVDGPTRASFRLAWFVGLGLVAVTLAYFRLSGTPTPSDA
ncbi:hypothetical protein NGM10_16720 (plasmid) [Halorussus salilacus]|uniref:hypothetical protein n=1 Tax=Halorussus salilacus TaxID=2953750 RepID=UPI00209EF99E|nr:hypothetical protein [Halorussus salilacus]USZ69741.1 hypothetical protein NGM10_16720 [Halorussus salilacus]